MKIGFVTLFPEMISGPLSLSITGRAQKNGLVEFAYANPRDFAEDAHKTVDDRPYGGGPGMVMMAPIVDRALQSLVSRFGEGPPGRTAVIVPDPTGEPYTQATARELAQVRQAVIVCGHYEGIDERFVAARATHRVSLGDFVLTGGEIAALAIADSLVRLLPGALGESESLAIDSHANGLLSAPQYTRPEVWEGLAVPEILRSGNHVLADKWKRKFSLEITRARRPDLFALARLEKGDADMLSS